MKYLCANSVLKDTRGFLQISMQTHTEFSQHFADRSQEIISWSGWKGIERGNWADQNQCQSLREFLSLWPPNRAAHGAQGQARVHETRPHHVIDCGASRRGAH